MDVSEILTIAGKVSTAVSLLVAMYVRSELLKLEQRILKIVEEKYVRLDSETVHQAELFRKWKSHEHKSEITPISILRFMAQNHEKRIAALEHEKRGK